MTMTGLEGKYPQLEPPTDAIKGAVPVEGTEEEPNDEGMFMIAYTHHIRTGL